MHTDHPPRPLTFPVAFPDLPGYLVVCNLSHEEARRILGPPIMVDWAQGLGECDFWAFEFRCGLQVVYQFYHVSGMGLVLADSPEVHHVLRHLPFQPEDCVPITESSLQFELNLLLKAFPERRQEIDDLHAFQVWRQDDNGNSFQVGEPTSERDARCWVQHFESLGHKQMYWYSAVATSSV